MKQLTNQNTIMKLKPKSEEPYYFQLETGRREIVLTDVTYETIDLPLLKKYFPFIYKNETRDSKLIKRKKGSKE